MVFWSNILFVVLITPIGLVEHWKKTKYSVYIVYAMMFIMLILSTIVLTSQVIHTYAINVFVWTTIGNFYNREFELQDAIRKGDEIEC